MSDIPDLYAAGHRAGATEMREACVRVALEFVGLDSSVAVDIQGAIRALPLPAPTEQVTQDDAELARALIELADRWEKIGSHFTDDQNVALSPMRGTLTGCAIELRALAARLSGR